MFICITDYGGISPSRLELLEERLKDDVITELEAFGGRCDKPLVHLSGAENIMPRILLHTETAGGSVIPVWEEVQPGGVAVLKNIMASRQSVAGVQLQYIRIPITPERSADFSDINELMDLAARTESSGNAIVVNCQLGRGRSTLASVGHVRHHGALWYLTSLFWLSDYDPSNSAMAQGEQRTYSIIASDSHSLSVIFFEPQFGEP